MNHTCQPGFNIKHVTDSSFVPSLGWGSSCGPNDGTARAVVPSAGAQRTPKQSTSRCSLKRVRRVSSPRLVPAMRFATTSVRGRTSIVGTVRATEQRSSASRGALAARRNSSVVVAAMPPPRAPLPPPILSNVPGTWAHDTMSRRVKDDILMRLFEENDFDALGMQDAKAALSELADELASAGTSRLRHLKDDGGPDLETWRQIMTSHVGKTWLDAPWAVTEFYLYRRIMEALSYWTTSYDPFMAAKAAGLESAVASTEAISKRLNTDAGVGSVEDGWRLFIDTGLWGNRMDLSLWPAGSSGNAQERFAEVLAASEAQLLADDLPAVMEVLRDAVAAGGKRMDIIVDNAGFELVTDLCLADYLIQSGAASSVVFQLKAHPTFVSDAMAKDLLETLNYFAALSAEEHPECVAAAQRWLGYVEGGEWVLREELFWVQPSPMWEMPQSVRASLAESALVFVKGDANYRRLLGDLHWPLDTPFTDVVSYFPSPVCALRTLKAELGCGMPADKTAAAAAADDKWLVNGRWGVIHFSPVQQ